MKIQDLLAIEDFPTIACRTLGRHFRATGGHNGDLQWRSAGSRTGKLPHEWCVNPHINAIFHYTGGPAAFGPVRREYSRATRASRSLMQRAYLLLSTHRPTAPWMAAYRLGSTQPFPLPPHALITGGNNHMRIFDHLAGTSTLLLKEGFDSSFLIAAAFEKDRAAGIGIPVPPTRKSLIDHGILVENLERGTPINRLGSQQRNELRQQTWRQITRLHAHTQVSVDPVVLASSWRSASDKRLAAISGAAQAIARQISATTLDLENFISKCPHDDFTACQTHGDLQDANVLQTPRGIVLIDWEYSDHRFALYDLITLFLAGRQTKGLAERLLNSKDSKTTGHLLPTRLDGAMFFLADLELRVREATNPYRHFPTPHLLALVRESHDFMRKVEE